MLRFNFKIWPFNYSQRLQGFDVYGFYFLSADIFLKAFEWVGVYFASVEIFDIWKLYFFIFGENAWILHFLRAGFSLFLGNLSSFNFWISYFILRLMDFSSLIFLYNALIFSHSFNPYNFTSIIWETIGITFSPSAELELSESFILLSINFSLN